MATDQFCLRWNNFQVNITSALESLKCDEDLVDVTLTCDGQNVKAHKVILSACSPYFRNLFRENPCQHPVVILKDVSYEDVTALLNFMYQGEVYITQDRLAPFLHTAELLQVRGLAGATNPFKESQPASLRPQSPHPPKQQQQPIQPKLKKSSHVPSTQLRRVTPPLSVSPTAIPHQTTSKPLPYTPPYRPAKSPLVSPTSREMHLSSVPSLPLKEKPAVPPHVFAVQNREMDASNTKSSVSQSNSASVSLTSYAPGSEQSPVSSYATLPEQQSYSSGQIHSSYQHQHGREPSPTFPSMSPDERSSSQPSSPQPSSAKRRKAFPRRLSSGSSSQIPADDESDQLKDTSAEEFEVVRVIPSSVKQEPLDNEEPEDNTHDDVDIASRHSGDSEDMEMTDFYTQSNMESEEPVSLEPSVKEEAAAEGASEVSPHSMLLRSLAGVHAQQSDDADYQSHATSSTEAFLLPTWDTNNSSNSDVFPSSTNWSLTKRRVRLSSKSFSVVDGRPFLTPEGLQVVQLKNDSLAIPGGQIQVPVVGANAGDYYTSGSYSSVAARIASRTLYQKRKHVWRSRRPVQCPNCQKVITMAYNLKSHLSTCLKRNGGLYRKT